VVSVQSIGEHVLGTDEVRPTNGAEPIVETVDAPTTMIEDQVPTEDIAWDPTDTEWETVPVSPPSSPVSTAATTVVAGQVSTALTVRSTQEEENEIMLMLEKTMEKVCKWSERVEAQTLATVERDIMIWKT
jgi:hypothetical protein